jgi:tetratricopeptide (TPR) repeat protein
LSSLADIVGAQGDRVRAGEYQQESLRLFTELNDASGMARVLADLGNLARDSKAYPEAMEYYRESLRRAAEAGRRTNIARALVEMAECASSQSRPEKAVLLAGSASMILQSVAASGGTLLRRTALEIIEKARMTMNPSEHARMLARSRRWTLDEIVKYALDSG